MICPECAGEFVDNVRRCPDCDVALVVPEPESDRPRPDPAAFESSGDSIVVLRTGRLFEADMAASALETAGVPHFRQEQSSSGLSFAMPAAPSAGPGILWVVRVPEAVAEQARSVLEELPIPIEESPGVWDFSPTERAKSLHRSWALALLILFTAAFFAGLISLMRQLLGG